MKTLLLTFTLFSSLANAAADAPKGAFDRSTLPTATLARKLCDDMAGVTWWDVLQKMFQQKNRKSQDCGLNLKSPATDSFVELATAICKGNDRERTASCFKTAAKEIGSQTQSYLYSSQQIAFNKRLNSDSKGCRNDAVCLEQVFKSAVSVQQQLHGGGLPAEAPVTTYRSSNQTQHSTNAAPNSGSQNGASIANQTPEVVRTRELAEARVRAMVRRGQMPGKTTR